ncbi:hypothetical protein V2E67_001728 [Citrobacter freundii]|nr:hypothetical protein [Citrobacter freundii]
MFIGVITVLNTKIRSEQGSVVVEFAFYVFIFMLMCGILMDMTFSLSKKSELDRVNNSLISVLRERNALYDGRIIPTQQDFEDINKLAKKLLTGNNGTVLPYQLELRVIEQIDIAGIVDKDKEHFFYMTSFVSSKISGCDIPQNLPPQRQLEGLSVWGIPPSKSFTGEAMWYPVYELTLCVPGAVSYFHQMLGVINGKLGSLYIRNVALPRI